MPRNLERLFVYGFPSLYGGAGTELHHQIIVWLAMGMDVHLIPSNGDYLTDPLYNEMIHRGVHVHHVDDWDALEPSDPVLGFCNGEFLKALPIIRERTHRTVFINCMTWLFDKEKEAMAAGHISMFLYQNDEVRIQHENELCSYNYDSGSRFMTFVPYFHMENFPFVKSRPGDHFGCGRISRSDADKFSSRTLHIYEHFVSPKWKQGLFLGFDHRSQEKIGTPYHWIRVAKNHLVISQQDFYKHCEIVLQPSDTTENWPRIGFEAMASGSILIVDNRGGWKMQVRHGETGWLCNNERDFIFYASKMAYEPNQREDMAEAARLRALEIGGLQASMTSWEEIFVEMSELPLKSSALPVKTLGAQPA